MPRYIIERDVGKMSRQELDAAARRSVQAIRELDGIMWVRSYISEAEGKIYCEYDAPNPAAIVTHARKAGIPVSRISEIALEINPDMFV
jgi:hypothetical protein